MAAAWFLLADRIAAARGGSDLLQPRPLGGGWAALGAAFFVAAVAVAGVPPLAGFMGKALLLQAAGTTPLGPWVVAGVLASSLAVMVALARAGSIALLEVRPRRRCRGGRRVAGACGGRRRAAGARCWRWPPRPARSRPTPAPRRGQLLQRQGYIDAVMGAQPVPAAWDVRQEMRERGDAK